MANCRAAFPVCTELDVLNTLGRRKSGLCFGDGRRQVHLNGFCLMQPATNTDPNGKLEQVGELVRVHVHVRVHVQPVPLNSAFPAAFKSWERRVFGSGFETRYCPMVSVSEKRKKGCTAR